MVQGGTAGPIPAITISPRVHTVMESAYPGVVRIAAVNPNPAPTRRPANASTRCRAKPERARATNGCSAKMSTPFKAISAPYVAAERPWLRMSIGSVTKTWKNIIHTRIVSRQKATNGASASGAHGDGREVASVACCVSGILSQTMAAYASVVAASPKKSRYQPRVARRPPSALPTAKPRLTAQ